MKRDGLLDGCEIHMQQLSWPTAHQGPQWGHWWSGLKLLAMSTFPDAIPEVASHAGPPEPLLHER